MTHPVSSCFQPFPPTRIYRREVLKKGSIYSRSLSRQSISCRLAVCKKEGNSDVRLGRTGIVTAHEMLAMPRAARCPCHATRATRSASSVSKPGLKRTAASVAHQHVLPTFAVVFFTMERRRRACRAVRRQLASHPLCQTKIILGNEILIIMGLRNFARWLFDPYMRSSLNPGLSSTLARHNCIGHAIPREIRTRLGEGRRGDRCSVALRPVQCLKASERLTRVRLRCKQETLPRIEKLGDKEMH